MQVLYLQSEQVNGIHNLEDIHIQSSTSTATVSPAGGAGSAMPMVVSLTLAILSFLAVGTDAQCDMMTIVSPIARALRRTPTPCAAPLTHTAF